MTTEPTPKHQEEARAIVNSVVVGIQTGSGYVAPDADTTHCAHLPTLTDRIAAALSARDQEVREVLEGMATHQVGGRRPCWCPSDYESEPHLPACLAARGLWNAVIGKEHEDGDTQSTP